MSNVTPWSWAAYQRPTMTNTAGMGASGGQHSFFTPAGTMMPQGTALDSFLMPNGGATDQNTVTNRTVKYDGGLTREALFNSTDFLNNAMGKGFEGVNTALNNFGGLGGLGGMSGASPVYRPNGGPVGQGASNGQPLPWGLSNPFNQTF